MSAQLLAAILEDLDDDAPRLVYASAAGAGRSRRAHAVAVAVGRAGVVKPKPAPKKAAPNKRT